MNEKLQGILLSLTTNSFDLTLIKEALKNLDCPLEKEIQSFVSRISRATTIAEVFTAFFQLAPNECFVKGGAIDTVFKPLLIAYASSNQRPNDFYSVIYSASVRFRNDKNWLPRVLTGLSKQELEVIFVNAGALEIKQLFSYLKDFWDNEAAQTIFLSKLSKNTWIQFLNHLGWDYLSPLNLTALAKESIQLRHALASWLKIHLKQPTQEFLAFVEAQKLFAIPDVTNLLLRDTQEPRNDFETAFVERENRDQENLHDFLMGSLLDNNALFQLNNLSTHDQLLAYSLLMLEIGQKKLLLENIPLQNQAGSAAKVDLDNLEITKDTFFAKTPWLALINQHMAFPTKLIPMLAANLTPLTQNEITEYLEIAECLPESVVTIEEWVARNESKKRESRNSMVFINKHLVVLNVKLNIRQIKSLAKILTQIPETDIALSLLDNNLSDEGAKILTKALKKNAIRWLKISSNNIGVEGAKALGEALKISTSIKQFDLSGNPIGYQGAKVLADVLRVNTSLIELRIQFINLGIEGTKALAEALKANTNIKHFDLSYNPIGDEGAKVLADVLRMNTRLIRLEIQSINLGREGAKALGEALEINTSLTMLDLSSNSFGLEGIKALSQGLKNNIGIKKLLLRYTHIGDEGGQVLLDAVESNTCLLNIDIDYFGIDSQIRVEIEKVLSRNRSYFDSHNKIIASLTLVREKLVGKEKLAEEDFAKQAAQAPSDQAIIQNALNDALDEVQKLCRTTPYKYAHAEKLLHKTYYWIAATYKRYEDYSSFIALYFDYFVLHPDQKVNFQCVSILILLSDETYALAGLTLQDKQQLILALLTENHETFADTFRVQALHLFKGGKGIPQGTLASVAGVGNETIPGKIITFAELVALTNEVSTTSSQILLEQITSNVIEVAVYEQVITNPHQVILVKFENGVLNIEKFRCYAEEASRIQIKLKKLIAIDFYAAIKQDQTCLFKELNQLSPSEVNVILKDTQNVEIRKQFLSYLQTFSNDGLIDNTFLSRLSTTTWLEFLNSVTLEQLSTLNLVEIAKASEELPHALAIWITPKLCPSSSYLNFIDHQKLFAIPSLLDLTIQEIGNLNNEEKFLSLRELERLQFLQQLRNDAFFQKLVERKEKISARKNDFGQDFKKNEDKYEVITQINQKVSTSNSSVAEIYQYIRDNESKIRASTRSDVGLSWWLLRGSVDSVPLLEGLLKKFRIYDSSLESNYLASKTNNSQTIALGLGLTAT